MSKPPPNALYAWVFDDPNSPHDAMNIMGAMTAAGHLPMVTTRADIATGRMADIAQAHARAHGHEVRLVRFVGAEVVKVLGPN